MKLFHGKPIIFYTIQAVKDSGLFDRIVVCTDSLTTADYVSGLGVETKYMPDWLSNDNAKIIDVVKYVDEGSDMVALLYACSPFMTGPILNEAYVSFIGDKRPLLAVSDISGGIKSDAGMFCFYDGKNIARGNFRFFHVPGARDINTPEDWAYCEELFTKKGT